MKAIILAAGKGSRISRYIDGKPKCTVELEPNLTLIEYTISLLRKHSIDDITILLGYRSDVIRSLLEKKMPDIPVKLYENPFYEVTNSIASLWFAQKELETDQRLIIINGDVFLSEKAMEVVKSENRTPVLFYDVTRKAEADYKFCCEGDRIVKYGKGLTLEETSGEYVGCATFDASFSGCFVERLNELIHEQKYNMWWEDVLYSMAGEKPVIAKDIEGAFWGEVDFIEDYERIMSYHKSTQSGAPGKEDR